MRDDPPAQHVRPKLCFVECFSSRQSPNGVVGSQVDRVLSEQSYSRRVIDHDMLTAGFGEGTHGREDSTAHRGGWKLSRVQGAVASVCL